MNAYIGGMQTRERLLAEGENISVIADFMKERCWKTF